MPETVPSPRVPKYSDNVPEDIRNLYRWATDWYKARVIQQRTNARIQAAADIEQLTQTISATPTQSEVQNIQNKINEMIQSLQ